MIFMPKFHIFEIIKGQFYSTFLYKCSISLLTLKNLEKKKFCHERWLFGWIWQRMKAGILNNLYIYIFPIPKQLFSKDYFAVYNNTLRLNGPYYRAKACHLRKLTKPRFWKWNHSILNQLKNHLQNYLTWVQTTANCAVLILTLYYKNVCKVL